MLDRQVMVRWSGVTDMKRIATNPLPSQAVKLAFTMRKLTQLTVGH